MSSGDDAVNLRSWCSGPMVVVFDAALDGDEQAINQALSVCAACPMLEACTKAWRAQPAKLRMGVMAGHYTPANLPLAFFPEPPAKRAPAVEVVTTTSPEVLTPQAAQVTLFALPGGALESQGYLQSELPLEWAAALSVAA